MGDDCFGARMVRLRPPHGLMAEGQDFAHDTLYRALNQPLASFFELSPELCKAMGGLDGSVAYFVG
jgi:hypothetical protein